MANNNWKYSTLNQRERLGMIKNGNNDVYEHELANIENLRSIRNSAGLDTVELDKWNDAVVRAKKSYDREQFYKNVPKYTANTNLSEAFERFDAATSSAEEAIENAKKSIAALDESYANSGIQVGTAAYEDEKKRIKEILDETIGSIESSYGVKFGTRISNKVKRLLQ